MVNILIFTLAVAMIVGVTLFVIRFNKKNEEVEYDEEFEEDFDEDCCKENCGCHTEAPVESAVVEEKPKAPMVTIKTLDRVKTKTKQWLVDQGKTKAETDAILSDITVPFDATGMDLTTAPFEYNIN